jgi:hypothetical protein
MLEDQGMYRMDHTMHISLRQLNRIIPKLSSMETPHLASRTAHDASTLERKL